MEIRIYQINMDRDEDIAFRPYDFAEKHGIDPSTYDCIYDGELAARDLEDVFGQLNSGVFPEGYQGRSLSVSDVCEVIKDEQSEFYYCDSIGFKKIEFDASEAVEYKEATITAVACYPGKTAQIITLPNTLEAKQEFVMGHIEAVYSFDDPVAIICNEEGKLNGLELNRALYDENGKVYDIVSGPMLVVGLTESDFGSLRGELLEKYLEKYKQPEAFIRIGDDILAIKMDEEKLQKEEKQEQTHKNHIHK